MLAFYPPANGDADRGPTLAERLKRYPEEALPLARRACQNALDDAGLAPADVAQLVTVSCTGFSAPGIDIALIDTLGLPPTVGRTLVGFMGCHGAMNGLRVAHGVAHTHPIPPAIPLNRDGRTPHPGTHVLLCCVELCTLHFQYGWDPEKVVANAIFADGAAAVVARLANHDEAADDANPHGRVAAHGSCLLPDSRGDMTWLIRDHGFEMTLSARVPALIEQHLEPWFTPWLASQGLTARDVGGWAIHPGGPRVISAVERALDLPVGAGDVSRAVLAECGNMSSPTVLFIVERLRAAAVPRPWVALAFGPGLTAEAVLIR